MMIIIINNVISSVVLRTTKNSMGFWPTECNRVKMYVLLYVPTDSLDCTAVNVRR